MARLFVSLMVFLAPALTGWMVLNGVTDLRPAQSPWQRDDRGAVWYDTLDAVILHVGPVPVGLALMALGAVAGAVTYFVIRPATVFPSRRWR